MFDRRRQAHRRAAAGAVGVLVLSVGFGAMVPVRAETRPSDSDPGAHVRDAATVRGAHPSVSDDGTLVVFEAQPADDSGRARSVYLRDLAAPGSRDVELTTVASGVRPGDSVLPSISGDGCSVAVITQMGYDLFRDDDTGERWDVYRRVLPRCGGETDEWELVSTQQSADGDTSALDRVVADRAAAQSADGTLLAFTYQRRARTEVQAVALVDLTVPLGAENRSTDVAGTPLMMPDSTYRYRGQRQPDISSDGRFVTFASDAESASPVPTWGSGPTLGGDATSQVFVWDRLGDEATGVLPGVSLVSQHDGTAAEQGGSSPVISGDGRFVAFLSSSVDLVADAQLPACVDACPLQAFRTEVDSGDTVLVSRQNTAESDRQVAADQGASQLAITEDGSQVAFVTRARNLFPTQAAAAGEPQDGEIVVSEVPLGVVRRVSTLPDGVSPVPAVNSAPALSGSGRVVVFDTLAAADLGGSDQGGRQVVSVVRSTSLSAPALDVGTTAVNLPGNEWFLAVTNLGPSSFVPTTALATPGFTVTGGTCTLGRPIAPGEKCTVQLVLTPTAPGPVVGSVTVAESIPHGVSVTTPLSGAGGEPALFPETSGLHFDTTEVGSPSSASLLAGITNIGFGPTTIYGVVLSGAQPGDFAVVDDACSGRQLAANASCAVGVRFRPTDAGVRTALLTVVTTAGQYTSVVIDGDAARDPALQVPVAKVRLGDDVPFGGRGFTPGTTVLVGWADGRGERATVTVAADGRFMGVLHTSLNERGGVRTLVAQSTDQVAADEVRVQRRPVDQGL